MPRSLCLSDRIEVALDGPLDPLSVTHRSVSLTDHRGAPMVVRRSVEGGRLVLLVEIDEALWRIPPSALVLTLAGAPSAHALATRDGRLLARSARHVLRVRDVFGPGDGDPLRLVAFGQEPPDPATSLRDPGPWRLVFEGLPDPRTLRPDAFPLLPLADGLALEPLLPSLRWRCQGARLELWLSLASPHGRLAFDMRRCGLRDGAGRVPEPPVVLTIEVP